MRCLDEDVDELELGVLLDAVLLFPGGGEEGEGAAEAVLDEGGVGGFFEGADVAEDPGAAGVGEGGEVGFYSVFVFEAVLHDFELELSDGSEDVFVSLVIGFEELDGAFIAEL
jgi:hypothetical protein